MQTNFISIMPFFNSMDSFEARRKTFHVCIGLIIIYLFYTGLLGSIMLVTLIAIGGLISYVSTKRDVPIINYFLKVFERPQNIKRFPGRGAIFFLIGCLLAIQLFEKDVAIAAMLILTFGDAAPHFVNSKVPKTKRINGAWNNAIVKGTIVGIAAGFIAVAIAKQLILLRVSYIEALVGSAFAMIVGAVEIQMDKEPLDDNLLVPLAAGGIIALMRIYL